MVDQKEFEGEPAVIGGTLPPDNICVVHYPDEDSGLHLDWCLSGWYGGRYYREFYIDKIDADRRLNEIKGNAPMSEEQLKTEADIPKERFVVDSESKADWVMKKLSELTAEKEIITANYKARMEEITADYNKRLGRFKDDLKAFAAEEAKRRGRKTVTLPHGTLSFRTVPGRLVVEELEAEAFAGGFHEDSQEWKQTHKIVFDKDGYKELAEEKLRETGELLPGVEQVPEYESFSIKPGAKK